LKYNIKKYKNITLIVILFFVWVFGLGGLLSSNYFSANLLFVVFLCITNIIIIYKLISNLRCSVTLYDDNIFIKNKSKELVIKLVDILEIEVWFIFREKYIVINYGDDKQIKLEYLNNLYSDLNNKLERINGTPPKIRWCLEE